MNPLKLFLKFFALLLMVMILTQCGDRIAAADSEEIQRRVGDKAVNDDETLDDVIRRRADFLVDYQDQALSYRYLELVERVRKAEIGVDGDGDLADAVARSYFKVLSYKDEYEVARLHTQTGFLEKVRENFGDKAKLRFHMAPPLISRQKEWLQPHCPGCSGPGSGSMSHVRPPPGYR